MRNTKQTKTTTKDQQEKNNRSALSLIEMIKGKSCFPAQNSFTLSFTSKLIHFNLSIHNIDLLNAVRQWPKLKRNPKKQNSLHDKSNLKKLCFYLKSGVQ